MLFYNNKLMKVFNNSSLYNAQNTLLDGLVSYWDFNGDANDKWNNNDGTIVGASLTTGKINQSYSFDGVDDHINNISDWDYQLNGNEYTVSSWLYLTRNANEWVLWNGSNTQSTTANIGFGFLNRSINVIRAWVRDNSINDVYVEFSNTDLLNKWSHHVLVRDNTTLYYYVDGNLVGTDNNSSLSNVIMDETIFGAVWHDSNNAYTSFFNGKIDETGIWNRALTETEVSKLYNQSLGKTFTDLSYTPKFNRQPDTYTPNKLGYGLLKDLVSYWSLLDATDSHRNNDASVTGATSGETGIIDTCYSFDGVDDRIELSKIDLSLPFSVSFWFKRGDLNEGAIFSQWSNTDTTKRIGIYINSSNILQFYINSAWENLISITNITQWYNVVVTHDSGLFNIYVNNILVFSDNENKSSDIYNIFLGVFYASSGFGNWWNGYIDELGYWNRSLTKDEIKTLYNNGNGLGYNNFRY